MGYLNVPRLRELKHSRCETKKFDDDQSKTTVVEAKILWLKQQLLRSFSDHHHAVAGCAREQTS